MGLRSYGVFAGQVLGARAEGSQDSPHFQVHLQGGGEEFRIAVNVLSQLSPPELLYVAVEQFSHPMTSAVAQLPDGFTEVARAPGGVALDFIRGNLFDRADLLPMPASAPGPDNDLADRLDHFTRRAAQDPTARVFAFGERWGPEQGVEDKVFGFLPGQGVHDIHMNQGNSGRFTSDDGVWQDGGLLFHFPDANQWVAVFLAFQSQSWHTDDETGHALGVAPGPAPAPTEPDGSALIIGALVNPVGPAPEAETVTVMNPTPAAVDLSGWTLVDRNGQAMPVPAVVLPAGETLRVAVVAPLQLGNRGGTLTLLDTQGLKVHGVAYTQEQAAVEGRTIVF
jgi:uncharacterized protein YukJ